MEENIVSSNIKRETTNGLKNISHAGLFPRFVAVIVDLAIMAFVFFGLLLFTQNVICVNSSYVKNAKNDFYNYNVESGLYQWNEKKDSIIPLEYESYGEYEQLFYSYYTDYLVNKCPEEYRISYNSDEMYWFNVHVLGQSDDLNLYDDEDKLNDLVKVNGPTLFTYKLDSSSQPIYSEMALPRAQNNDPNAEIDETTLVALKRYFYISDADNKNNEMCYYHIITEDLASRKFVSKAYDQFYNHYYHYPIVACLLVSALIFFFAIPMIFSNGETLGKLMFHLGLVNKLGYKYSRSQLIPRYLSVIAVVVLLYFFFGLNLWFFGIVTFLALASYGLAIFTKEHKSINDYLAGTIVINKVKSEIFKDANDEQRFHDAINEVKPIKVDIETPREESLLYTNDKFDDKDTKEG